MAFPKLLADAAPVFAAPMAGGPTTPALVVSASRAGHFGQLAAGYKTVEGMTGEIAQVRDAGVQAFGVNLFVPNPVPITPGDYLAYAEHLAPIAAELGQTLPELNEDGDDLWAAKVDALVADPVPVLSFTFGLPPVADIRRLREAGSFTLQTVTSVAEARAAQEAGVDGLAVQGFAAGGHSGIWDGTALPPDLPLTELIRGVSAEVALPLLAAGGISSADQVRDVLAAGANAVVVGTMLMRSDEAGTSQVHKNALADPQFDRTVLTRAFTGRAARALVNDFTRRFTDVAPSGYPALHYLTRGIRSASAAADDPSRVHLWAGEGWRDATTGPVATALAALLP
ncbi:MAG: nitronate monooxygenase [Dermatophilus congolensis]|nr:nitronate monooxygenase [Dermatophilus congolensis]